MTPARLGHPLRLHLTAIGAIQLQGDILWLCHRQVKAEDTGRRIGIDLCDMRFVR